MLVRNQLVLDIKLVVKTPGSYQRNVRRPCTKEVDASRGRSLAGGCVAASARLESRPSSGP
jgi:hypothetical protein